MLPIQSAAVCEAVCGALEPLTTDPELGRAAALLQSRLVRRKTSLVEARNRDRSLGLWRRLLLQLERMLDPLDAIFRRRAARRTFRDLAARRISHGTARETLKALTKRQKGGWLLGGRGAVRSSDLGTADPGVFG